MGGKLTQHATSSGAMQVQLVSIPAEKSRDYKYLAVRLKPYMR